jgi:hypothetical protein
MPVVLASAIVLFGVGVFALMNAIRLPVPDTASPPSMTTLGTVNDQSFVGQSFRAERDNLCIVELVLAVGHRSGDAPLRFYVRESVLGEPIRTVLVDPQILPFGNPTQYVPGRIDERWFGFDFQPIADSAGKQYYFSMEGPGILPEDSIRTLLFFHNGYKEGQAYLNGQPVNAHVVFRTYSQTTLAEGVMNIASNLQHGRPGMLGSWSVYALLGFLYTVLGAVLVVQTFRFSSLAMGRQSPTDASQTAPDT